MEIIKYFNPCSSSFHAIDDFKKLKTKQKLISIVFTALASLGLGLGGVAAFRFLVEKYTFKNKTKYQASEQNKALNIKNEENSTLKKVETISEKMPGTQKFQKDSSKKDKKVESSDVVIPPKSNQELDEKISDEKTSILQEAQKREEVPILLEEKSDDEVLAEKKKDFKGFLVQENSQIRSSESVGITNAINSALQDEKETKEVPIPVKENASSNQTSANQEIKIEKMPIVIRPKINQKFDKIISQKWPEIGVDFNYTPFYQQLVGGQKAYDELPTLDLSKLEKFCGGTGYPDSIPLDKVTSPIMRGINGYTGHDYLLIKFYVGYPPHYLAEEELRVLFWANGQHWLNGECGGYSLKFVRTPTHGEHWDVLHHLCTQGSLYIAKKKYCSEKYFQLANKTSS